MLEFIKEVLIEETKIAARYKAKGIMIIKLSSIAVILFATCFVILGIQAMLMGGGSVSFVFITMTIVIVLSAVYVYGDIGGIINGQVRPNKISGEEKSSRQTNIPHEDRPIHNNNAVSITDISDDTSDDIESIIRNYSPTTSTASINPITLSEAYFDEPDGREEHPVFITIPDPSREL